jgi:putative oxidoreductase
LLAKLFGTGWEWGLLIGRVVLGVVFIAHGYQKLFVAGPDQVAGFLANLGIPAPGFFAWVLSLTEFFGGIAVLIGLFTRYAALGLAIAMTVSTLTAKLNVGLIALPGVPVPGFELDLSLLALALVVLLSGPGKLSLEKMILAKEI